jgi:hypothetical protein
LSRRKNSSLCRRERAFISRLDFVALEQIFRQSTAEGAGLPSALPHRWTALKGIVSDIASSHDEIIAVTLEGPVASPIAFMAFDEGQRPALGEYEQGRSNRSLSAESDASIL